MCRRPITCGSRVTHLTPDAVPSASTGTTETLNARARSDSTAPPQRPLGDEERVFCSQTGGPLDPVRYAATLRVALERAKIAKPMRPFHDGRHTSITNAAAAGTSPAALMARAGHSDFKTTQGYIDLAGETFRDEAELLEERLFGQKSGQK